jgi:hypothetical protein
MGLWNLDNIHAFPPQPLTGATFGNSFGVSFYLRYTPETTWFRRKDRFEETPRLEWIETITMKESGGQVNGLPRTPQFWKFHTDMYRHNPSSRTLIAWRKRYLLAYKHVANEPYTGFDMAPNCFVQLLSFRNSMLTIDDLGGLQQDDFSKAEAVRNYISENGCQMIIHLKDVPAIALSNDFTVKERLLEFNIGVQGQSARIRAYQYLKVDNNQPQIQWDRELIYSSNISRDVQPGGHGVSSPPDTVSTPRNNTAYAQFGEYD